MPAASNPAASESEVRQVAWVCVSVQRGAAEHEVHLLLERPGAADERIVLSGSDARRLVRELEDLLPTGVGRDLVAMRLAKAGTPTKTPEPL